MRKLEIDCNWDYRQAVAHIRDLRKQYESILNSFSYFEMKAKTRFMTETRIAFYLLNFEEWKIDKLWSYMNGDETYPTLTHIK